MIYPLRPHRLTRPAPPRRAPGELNDPPRTKYLGAELEGFGHGGNQHRGRRASRPAETFANAKSIKTKRRNAPRRRPPAISAGGFPFVQHPLTVDATASRFPQPIRVVPRHQCGSTPAVSRGRPARRGLSRGLTRAGCETRFASGCGHTPSGFRKDGACLV